MTTNRFFPSAPSSEDRLNNLLIRMLDLLDPSEKEAALRDILRELKILDLSGIDKRERICLIDSAIKFGSMELVTAITEKYIALGLQDDIRVPYENHGEHAFRPVFWLAAVATRLPGIPEENYNAIEKYLCEKFNIPVTVVIDGTAITRDEYVKAVTAWKQQQNAKLRQQGRDSDRYVIPESGTQLTNNRFS
ncbi:hypothetical protein AQUSIP_05170 [Aquicella siphonis]|uniref:Uncharacterized protein n=1 Tax=Aquicella siphonis TaxID=254247 RepID=A0A5E4PE32_9COXI|nr:hypothetical protein [Aquicella siphonis]VVC75229.1 hypothetical protein AQUSIP_05170 [Aquicella siphonis]